MLSRVLPLFLLLAIPCIGICQDVEYRHWTTSRGQRSGVRLTVIELTSDVVKLKREDNAKIVTMKRSGLSQVDRDYLADRERQATMPSSRSPEGSTDWPQWRGPNRIGKSADTGLLKSWPAGGPELLWNITGLGDGYSTPAVVGNSVYVLGTQGGDEYLVALSASDGQPQWQTPFGRRSGGGGFPGPKGTPSVDGDRIYVLGGGGDLACINRDGGDIVWTKNLRSEFAGQVGHWEYAESPLVDGNKLICTPGGSRNTLVALDKSNGRLLWNSNVGAVTSDGFATAGYASTIAAQFSGVDQYVAFLQGGVVGVEANSGKPLWHYDAPANQTANCSTPVAQDNAIFAASGYGTGGGKAQISRRGANWFVNESFFVNKMQNHHGGFVLHEGHIYGTNETGLLCIDWNSGRIQWQDRSVGKGSTTFADGNLIVRGEKGAVALVAANPSGYQELGRFDQPDRSGKNAWAHPVVAGGKLYLHDHDRMLCYQLKP